MKKLLVLLVLVCSPAFAGPKLYVFDCGSVSMDSLAMFNIAADESDVKRLFVPCYLVEHSKGRLFWDGGLPRSVADKEGPVPIEGGEMVYQRWIIDQLADMKITPSDIDKVAYSHLHFDHAGVANDLVQGEVIMQQTEWDAAFGEEREFVDTSLFEGLKQAQLTFVEGDHDVFGDGSVRLIYAPGHTPGHQVLYLELENTGPLILSGDLYHTRANRTLRRAPGFNHDAAQTLASMDKVEKLIVDSGATLWIEHDQTLADTLKKAPQYYD